MGGSLLMFNGRSLLVVLNVKVTLGLASRSICHLLVVDEVASWWSYWLAAVAHLIEHLALYHKFKGSNVAPGVHWLMKW